MDDKTRKQYATYGTPLVFVKLKDERNVRPYNVTGIAAGSGQHDWLQIETDSGHTIEFSPKAVQQIADVLETMLDAPPRG